MPGLPFGGLRLVNHLALTRREHLRKCKMPSKSTTKTALEWIIEPADLILGLPTPAQVKEARERAGLTLKQAAALAGSPNARAWLRYESAERQMGVDRWSLFLLALGQHPHYRLVRT